MQAFPVAESKKYSSAHELPDGAGFFSEAALEPRDAPALSSACETSVLKEETAVRRAARNFCALSLALSALLHAGARAAVNETMSEEQNRLASGEWGGQHVRVEVSDDGALLDFDGGHGVVGRPITLDGEGRFSAPGTYTRETGGPVREGREPKPQPAVYSGVVTGTEMTLKFTLTETKEEVGPYTLTRGSRGRVWKMK